VFHWFTASRTREDFLSLVRSLGYTGLTKLEQRAVPFILQGKDLVVETADAPDSTNLLILPLFQRAVIGSRGIGTLVLSSSPDAVKRIGRQIKAVAGASRKLPETIQIGIDDNIRRELQLLAKPVDIVIGTPERLIDHIRRENVDLQSVRRVLIELPDDFEEIGFDKDLQFIYSKLPARVQTVLSCTLIGATIPLASMLRHPQVVRTLDEASRASCRLYQADHEDAKSALLSDIVFAKAMNGVLVLCKTSISAKAVSESLESEGIPARYLPASATSQGKEELARELASAAVRVVVADSPKAGEGLPPFQNLVFFQVPESAESYLKTTSILVEAESRAQIMILHSNEEANALKRFQEVQHVDTSNAPTQEEVLRGRIAAVVKRIRENEDPAELNRLRAIIRRNVPFFLRGYFAALLLKESAGKLPAPPQGEMKTLFVSIGKNRKVFPRDLSRLFSGALQVKPTTIGNIKVLDNYSFVDVPGSLADRAISLLDGNDFRGRKITVNHARKREEKED